VTIVCEITFYFVVLVYIISIENYAIEELNAKSGFFWLNDVWGFKIHANFRIFANKISIMSLVIEFYNIKVKGNNVKLIL